ncbi:MAG: efflux RND transporter periplasmic adaptor subunit [Thermoguttaceae bacterium]
MIGRYVKRLPGRYLLSGLLVVGLLIAGAAVVGILRPDLRHAAEAALDRCLHLAGGHDPETEADHHDHLHVEAVADSHGEEADHDHDHAGECEMPPGSAAKAEIAAHAEEGEHAGEPADGHVCQEAPSVALSKAAQNNVGLELIKVETRPFVQTISVPGTIVERPGRSTVQVAATLTGVVTAVRLLQGETITPGQPLFDLRLTHEEVVEAQSQYLQTLESLDVVNREIARLEKVVTEGVVSGKTLLDRRYEQQKLEGLSRAQQQQLMLHGLSEQQVGEIAGTRTLLASLTIAAPQARTGVDVESEPLFQVQEIRVTTGQHVAAGDSLCVLADHGTLHVQGKAFEQDMAVLNEAFEQEWTVAAVVEAQAGKSEVIEDLPIAYLANRVEPESRAFLFHAELPNTLLHDAQTPEGSRFSTWKFKPGQRVELRVPVERWDDRIVLPRNAVVQEGAEAYVFEKTENGFTRRPVHVQYSDQLWSVIANDGELPPGAEVVAVGAYQVHLAMKYQVGGAPDPHAGHNH